MAKWADFLPDLAAHLPGCPNFTIEHELRRAAIQFFERSRAWKATLEPTQVRDGQPEIEIEPDNPNEESIVRIEAAWFDGKLIKVISADELDASFHDDWMGHTGTPIGYVTLIAGETRLYPAPIAAGLLRVRVSIRPSDKATQLPDGLMTYRRAIGQGAMAQLRLYSAQPWTDIALASVNAAAFNEAIDKLTIHATRSHGRARMPSKTVWC